MLNVLNVLIGIEIELKIRDSTLPLFTHKTCYILLQLYINFKLPFFKKKLLNYLINAFFWGGQLHFFFFHITFKYL